MHIIISHCGSGVSDTYLHLLNASGTRIAYNNDNTAGCGNSTQAYLSQTDLPAGTYYIVSEGYSVNGEITTTITGSTGIEEPEDPVVPPPTIVLSTNQNYVLTKTAREATTTPTSLTSANSLQTVQYFDGLGRPVETIRIASGPQRNDIVSYQEYDAVGRELKSWLLPPSAVQTDHTARSMTTIRALPALFMTAMHVRIAKCVTNRQHSTG